MVDFKYYINNDWFKAGRFGEKHVKFINIALLVIATIFIFSLIFYLVIYTSTNYHALDNLQEYIKTYDAEENFEFERANIGMKIMPSYNREKNVLYMQHSNNIYQSKIPNSLSLMETFNMNNTFFFVNDTNLFFPKLRFQKENVPVGNSISKCLALSWSLKERGLNYDIMKTVKGFPQCQETLTGKFIWNTDDPKLGIDVPVWNQHYVEVDCSDDEDCDRACDAYNAIFVNGKLSRRCYYYEILDTICIVVEYNSVTDDYFYKGGCFKDNKHYLMVPAEKNKDYHFEGIEIEVRNLKDPVIRAGEMSNFTYSFGESMNWLAIILNILLILSFIGLCAIAYLIFYYRKKYNSGALLADKHPGFKSNKPKIEESNEEGQESPDMA